VGIDEFELRVPCADGERGVEEVRAAAGDPVSVASFVGILRRDANQEREASMNRNLVRTATRLGAVIALVGLASWAVAGKPPQNTAHPCQVAVSDEAGNSILSDGFGVYTDGVDGTGARLWDMKNGVADHLYFIVENGRSLKLSIPGVTTGTGQTCASANLRPNLNSDQYQFYNDLPVGMSTADVGQNFGGTFACSFGAGNRDSYNVTYESQCIVITHGEYGNTGSNPLEWTITADAPCTAAVTQVQKGKVVNQWVGQEVPFQVTATELP
jgi:hypothetical protein